MDEFTKRAEDVARRWKVYKNNRKYMIKEHVHSIGDQMQNALDALVAAAPDPRERFLKAANRLIGRWDEEAERGIVSRCDWSSEAKELWEAAYAYRRSLEGE